MSLLSHQMAISNQATHLNKNLAILPLKTNRAGLVATNATNAVAPIPQKLQSDVQTAGALVSKNESHPEKPRKADKWDKWDK
jgi:hypothetical protein